jgi:hypothetical protein
MRYFDARAANLKAHDLPQGRERRALPLTSRA